MRHPTGRALRMKSNKLRLEIFYVQWRSKKQRDEGLASHGGDTDATRLLSEPAEPTLPTLSDRRAAFRPAVTVVGERT